MLLVVNNTKANILAKPSGITLVEHITNVMSEAKYIEQQQSFIFEKYQHRIAKSLEKRLEVAITHHDDGKANAKWQGACQRDYRNYLKWTKTNKGSFKNYENEVGIEAGKNIRQAGVRHEFQSLKNIFNVDNPLALQAAIAAHHSKLSIKFEERWKNEGVSNLWSYFKKQHYLISETDSFSTALKNQYEVAGVRGLLQFSDRRASAKEGDSFVPDLKKFEYKFPHTSKRGVQKMIEKHWNEELLLIRAPTGSGKTDASLLWASLQIKNKKADRLIIAMPTRFTSNALAIAVAESLSDTGLYHSSAWFNKYQEKVKYGKIARNEAAKNHELARLLHTPITVSTIDHLLTTLTLSREDHHQITFNLANACLVIDEADFYDDFIQANILVLLEALKEWDVPVLIMSASLTESSLLDYQKIGYSANRIVEDNTDDERNRFEIESILNYESIKDIEHLLKRCIDIGTAIIYANTVDKAMLIYDYFKSQGIDAVVYHSRFTEPDKQKKEDVLIKFLGREAWENKNAKGIAILTQIGEMSINISADLMISEICPIDRLTQRAGRLCRFDKNKIGELHVILPHKNNSVYPAPYGNYDRKNKCWIPLEVLSRTIDVLELKRYSAKQLVIILNEIYSSNRELSIKSKNNSAQLKRDFRNNWLINPMNTLSIDDNDTNQWRSRDIGAQDIIFVERPATIYFRNYFDFQSWKLEHSISIPVYLIRKYEKNSILERLTILIGEDEESILVVKVGFYNIERGISLPKEDIFI
jgi:CRISPR-associated endonuclease/helicase Cas3